jgi:hypothetical protein
MSSPEFPGGEPDLERESLPYCRAARFAGERPAGQAYFQAQEAMRTGPANDLSVYRLQLDRVFHVVVLGDPPPAPLHDALTTILSAGEPTTLPAEVLRTLAQRRAHAIRLAPWVEGHYGADQP